ncbi:hypothetical protein KGF57_003939 [Candida theae]|uniref:Uncharacterized protein n=1 Tax=Candida theae TaxID=1198502 RepID=A0AAD5BCW1_9ASCO|nr:uncharacterized protein KGF57_003939 [Candida theae]KAI5953730.1 hypothetical protein KGF57_003939 [Candida theae]
MIISHLLYIIYPLIIHIIYPLIIHIITSTQALEVTINNVKLDNPIQTVKSKFKKYLPELQDNLEIPTRPNQQFVRESFVGSRIEGNNDKGNGHINHRGIKSMFKKHKKIQSSTIISLLSSSSLSSLVTYTSTATPKPTTAAAIFSDSDDIDDDDNDDGDDENNTGNEVLTNISASTSQVVSSINSSDTLSSTVHSRPSWIKSFLTYKSKQTMLHSMSVDHSRTRHRLINSNIDENRSSHHAHTDSKLTSKITEYEDSLSNPKDLKRWVQLIADKPTAISSSSTFNKNNENQKGGGGSSSYSSTPIHSSSIKTKLFTTGNKNDNQQLEIDIEEFINYLINEQGFNRDDLQFLRMKNLDYGLGEIEQELNKLKDQSGKPKVIKIGGEEDQFNNGGGNGMGSKLKARHRHALSLLYLSILVIF